MLDVQDWSLRADRAGTLETLGDLAGALVESKQVVDHQPDNPVFLNNHCYILVRMNRALEALPYCERAVASAPTIPEARHSYASVLAAVGQCEAAETQLAEARRLRVDDPLYRQPLTCVAKN